MDYLLDLNPCNSRPQTTLVLLLKRSHFVITSQLSTTTITDGFDATLTFWGKLLGKNYYRTGALYFEIIEKAYQDLGYHRGVLDCVGVWRGLSGSSCHLSDAEL